MAAVLLGRLGRVAPIDVIGGTLSVTWPADTGHVTLAGPAEFVYRGRVADPTALLARPR